MKTTNWTFQEDGKLRQLYDMGYTLREIAEELNRSKNSVIGRANRIGLKPRTRESKRDNFIVTKVVVKGIKREPQKAPEPVAVYYGGYTRSFANCQWIFDDGKFCCEEPAFLSAPYCQCHMDKAYTKTKRPMSIEAVVA